jgi:protein SCO1/2
MTRTRGKRLARVTLPVLLVLLGMTWVSAQRPTQYAMSGMVLKVDPSRTQVVVSHDAIPGVMRAMTMPFEVRDPKELDGVAPGMTVAFTWVLGGTSAHAERLRVVRYESVEQDPLTARRLALLKRITGTPSTLLTVGQAVPDFTLTNQARQRVTLSQFRGKVIALNFIYTSCALPQFCFRIANHFGVLQKRFESRVGRDLVLLTVTFDPARDTPERLAEYARQWNAKPDRWHFLTGRAPDVERVCNMFGVEFFADEGLMNHSVHTAIINRQGNLEANIEGNQFTAAQLGDLVETALNR